MLQTHKLMESDIPLYRLPRSYSLRRLTAVLSFPHLCLWVRCHFINSLWTLGVEASLVPGRKCLLCMFMQAGLGTWDLGSLASSCNYSFCLTIIRNPFCRDVSWGGGVQKKTSVKQNACLQINFLVLEIISFNLYR